MKKIALFSLMLTSFIVSSTAQVTIAPEVGVNLANMTFDNKLFDTDDTKMKLGLKAGAIVTIPVIKGFFIQPGIFYTMKGAKAETKGDLLGQQYEIKSSINTNYIEVPVNVGYEYKLGKAGGIFITAGPYLGYAFGGKTKAEQFRNGVSVTGVTEEDIAFGSEEGVDDMKPLDFGLNFSAGYKLPMGVYIKAQYGLGLSNLSNNDIVTIKNKVLSFSVGYTFKL